MFLHRLHPRRLRSSHPVATAPVTNSAIFAATVSLKVRRLSTLSEKRHTGYGGTRVTGDCLRRGSSVDRLLVLAIWPDASPATFDSANSFAIRGGDVRFSPFAVPARLDRKDGVTLCRRGSRLIGSFRSGIPLDNP